MSQDSAHLLIAPMISAIEKYNWSWVDGIAHDTGQLIALVEQLSA